MKIKGWGISVFSENTVTSFSYYSMKSTDLAETLLMSILNKCFYGEIRKSIPFFQLIKSCLSIAIDKPKILGHLRKIIQLV